MNVCRYAYDSSFYVCKYTNATVPKHRYGTSALKQPVRCCSILRLSFVCLFIALCGIIAFSPRSCNFGVVHSRETHKSWWSVCVLLSGHCRCFVRDTSHMIAIFNFYASSMIHPLSGTLAADLCLIVFTNIAIYY
jgi:hypothetical protein